MQFVFATAIYIYIYICVCVCVRERERESEHIFAIAWHINVDKNESCDGREDGAACSILQLSQFSPAPARQLGPLSTDRDLLPPNYRQDPVLRSVRRAEPSRAWAEPGQPIVCQLDSDWLGREKSRERERGRERERERKGVKKKKTNKEMK